MVKIKNRLDGINNSLDTADEIREFEENNRNSPKWSAEKKKGKKSENHDHQPNPALLFSYGLWHFPSITAALSSLRQGLYDHESQKYLITDPLQNSLATLVQANAMITIVVMVMMVVIIVVINYAIYLGGNKTYSQTI